eukprot:SAG25_NODE_1805_length_2312_cov_40.049706_1_plen_58_part_10
MQKAEAASEAYNQSLATAKEEQARLVASGAAVEHELRGALAASEARAIQRAKTLSEQL